MDKVKKVIEALKKRPKIVLAILGALASLATITATEADDKLIAKAKKAYENAIVSE